MLECPTGHGVKTGQFCDQCGAVLAVASSAADAGLRIRSPEAHATVQQTFVVPGAGGHAQPALVKCPKCGKRNPEPATFDCQGACGRQNLCERHFDEEHEVCVDCARPLRGAVLQEREHQAKILAELDTWRQRSKHAEAQLTELNRQGNQALEEINRFRTDQRKAQERIRSLEQDLSTLRKQSDDTIRTLRRQAEVAEERVAVLAHENESAKAELAALRATQFETENRAAKLEKDLVAQHQLSKHAEAATTAAAQRVEKSETALAQRDVDLKAARKRIKDLESDLAQCQSRAKDAQGHLADMDKAWRATEMLLRHDVEVARRRGEEANRFNTNWQQVGIELVAVIGGQFLYGDDNASVELHAFEIAKTPVTVAQFAAFIKATGYQTTAERLGSGRIYTGPSWKDVQGADWCHPRGPGSNVSTKANHPVTLVSRDDSLAFCHWAGLRLPTEQEWEKAARGTNGYDYPWGRQLPDAQRCNFNMNVKDTTPVDRYPDGASPYGLLDMAGNVWEWCENWHEVHRNFAVMRGGSWSTLARLVRSTVRDRIAVDYRNDNSGFRCARSL